MTRGGARNDGKDSTARLGSRALQWIYEYCQSADDYQNDGAVPKTMRSEL